VLLFLVVSEKHVIKAIVAYIFLCESCSGSQKNQRERNKGEPYSGSRPFFMAFCLSCCFCLSLSSLSYTFLGGSWNHFKGIKIKNHPYIVVLSLLALFQVILFCLEPENCLPKLTCFREQLVVAHAVKIYGFDANRQRDFLFLLQLLLCFGHFTSCILDACHLSKILITSFFWENVNSSTAILTAVISLTMICLLRQFALCRLAYQAYNVVRGSMSS